VVHIKLTSKIIVGFIIHIPVEYFRISIKLNSNFLVDDKTALTRDFVRGGNGSRTTPYYIWVPYILIAAALCAYLPAWLWHVIGHRATFDIPAMIIKIGKTNLTNPEEREKMLIALAQHYEKSQRYSKVNVRITDNLLKRLMSALMFFAGGGVLTGNKDS
jgi:hypothetical protein